MLRNGDSKQPQVIEKETFYFAPNPYLRSYFGIEIIDNFIRSLSSSLSFSSKSLNVMVVPALSERPLTLTVEALQEFEKYRFHFTHVKIKTFDEAELDGIEIHHLDHLEKKSPVYIIKFNGNGMLYETQLSKYANDAYRLNANVIAFNYRGVGKSTKMPECSQDLVTDGIAEVQRLLDRGVLPKHIVLDGISLGGGVATMVAKHFHDKNIRVNLFNDRSFSSISDAGFYMIYDREFPKALEYAMETTSSSIVSMTGWQINAARAYQTIPNKNKAYMFVTDDLRTYSGNQGDGVIREKASLHHAVQDSPSANNFFKMMCRSVYGGHNASRKELKSVAVNDLDGEQIFDSFVRRVTR